MAEPRELIRRKGLLRRNSFSNYDDKKGNVIAGYADGSMSRLWATSQKCDGDGIFQKGVPGGYHLPVQPAWRI